MRNYLKIYLKNRPLFLSLIRAKELELFQRYFITKNQGLTLDFGCGDGFFLKILMEAEGERIKADIIGLEVDEGKAEQARKSKVYRQVVVYKGEKIPFADNYFQTVISNCVLEHVGSEDGNGSCLVFPSRRCSPPKLASCASSGFLPDKAPVTKRRIGKILKEINRVLKPGGYFYCTVMTDNWEKYLFGNLILGKYYQRWMRKIQKHFNLLTANQWQKAFTQAQFQVKKVAGYLDKRACRWVDILHYVSISSLISYKFTGRWVLFPWQYDLLLVDKWLEGLIRDDVPIKEAAALFFIMLKEKPLT